MNRRGLSNVFLSAMREKLEQGRRMGYTGWDESWNCQHMERLDGIDGLLVTRLQQEMAELIVAIYALDRERILLEAADVANFAMMIADFYVGENLERLDVTASRQQTEGETDG